MKTMHQLLLNITTNGALTAELSFDAPVIGGCDYIPSEHKNEKARFSGIRGRFKK